MSREVAVYLDTITEEWQAEVCRSLHQLILCWLAGSSATSVW